MSYFFPAVGAAVALAGGDKLVGVRGYEGMFRHLGWSRESMQAAAAAELAGGLLMVPKATRRIGGAVVALASAAVLASEINHGDANLALPRCVVLLVALAATARRLAQAA
jgi:hypothetical protein